MTVWNLLKKGGILKLKNKISFLIIILFIIVGVFVYINWTFQPLSENKRNMSTSDIKMTVILKDTANRTPIIRTYTKEEFDKLDESGIARVKEVVNGNIEGDVPALKIENGIGPIEITFEKTENKGKEETAIKVIPEDVPEIKISVLETLYSDNKPKEIIDSLTESEEGKYVYEIKKYLHTQKIQIDEMKEFYAESMYIQIHYQIDGENYVSIFAINTIQDK